MRRILAGALLLAATAAAAAHGKGPRHNPTGGDFERLQFNNPEATTYLKAAIFGIPLVYDFNGDGHLDFCYCVFPSERDWCWSGIHYFENPTPKGERDPKPVFGPAKYCDGIPPRPRPEGEDYRDFWRGKPFDYAAQRSVHFNDGGDPHVEHADLNGDGKPDIVLTVNDRKVYGWHDQYDERGTWKPCISPCWFYVLWGQPDSVRGKRTYGEPEVLRSEDGYPIVRQGDTDVLVRDWDGDGDLDMITFDATDGIHFFENTGTKTKPVFQPARIVRDSTGARLAGHHILPTVSTYDWDGDGLLDIIVGEEDSRIGWMRNTGKAVRGVPTFDPPHYFRQKADELYFGVLACPFAYDLDGDGDEDLIVGNSAGEIGFIENLSGRGVEFPKWAEPKLIREPDGRPIRILAGPNGSIQGPLESKFGYTTLSVADWDGDGKPDIMANSIWGKPLWWRNIGSRRKPRFDFARGVEVEWTGDQPELPWGWFKPKTQKNPKEIITQWRTTPVMTDWDGDGLVDLVLCDTDGDLALWRRAKRGGKPVLLPPEKAFVDAANGKPLRASRDIRKDEWLGGWAGASGRRKVAVMDWDCDGKTDIVMNNSENAAVWRQERSEGGKWYFRQMAPTVAKEPLWSHNPQPAACDFNGDGRPDMLLGAMDGFIYYLRNPRTKAK